MQNSRSINNVRACRPYWVLLALALFFAGQIAAVSHWHDAATNSIDNDCALCVLSSAAGAAIASAAFVIGGIALALFIAAASVRNAKSRCVCVYQSRAPPLHS